MPARPHFSCAGERRPVFIASYFTPRHKDTETRVLTGTRCRAGDGAWNMSPFLSGVFNLCGGSLVNGDRPSPGAWRAFRRKVGKVLDETSTRCYNQTAVVEFGPRASQAAREERVDLRELSGGTQGQPSYPTSPAHRGKQAPFDLIILSNRKDRHDEKTWFYPD